MVALPKTAVEGSLGAVGTVPSAQSEHSGAGVGVMIGASPWDNPSAAPDHVAVQTPMDQHDLQPAPGLSTAHSWTRPLAPHALGGQTPCDVCQVECHP